MHLGFAVKVHWLAGVLPMRRLLQLRSGCVACAPAATVAQTRHRPPCLQTPCRYHPTAPHLQAHLASAASLPATIPPAGPSLRCRMQEVRMSPDHLKAFIQWDSVLGQAAAALLERELARM